MKIVLITIIYVNIIPMLCLLGPQDPDQNRDASQIIRSRGFIVEEHTAVTRDGYILGLQRMINPHIAPERRKRPLLLVHGIMASATDWLLNNNGVLGRDGLYREDTYPEPVAYRPLNGTNVPIGGSAAFVLSQFGYDVWLGNLRASVYSRGHTFLNYKTDSRYWMFTIDHIGLDDIPAMIQYVRDYTGQSKIGYIGHSLGCTAMFMLLSTRPQFADVLTDYIALAPAVFVNNTYGLPMKLLSPLQFAFRMLPMGIEPGNVVPLQLQLQGLFCGQKIISIFCGSFLRLLMGQNPLDVAYDRLGAFLSHFPNSVSTWVMAHLLQWAGTGRFQQFDYGPQENHVRYGQSYPPQYPLNNIKMKKISIFYSLNDAITEYRNVRMIKEYMTVPLYREILIPDKKWGHFDYFSSKTVGFHINSLIIDLLRSSE